MSAWPIPDEVVRELARFVVVECLGATEECVVPSDFDRARAFLTRHRLAQLPEEPDGWQAETHMFHLRWAGPYSEKGARGFAVSRRFATGRIRPRYVLPGQPITVGEEERDGDE